VAHLHLIIGPVGSGKSTFALQLAREHAAVRLNLDEWMAELFSPDRPDAGVMEWYVERTGRCIELIWKLATRMIEVGTNVILEIGLIQRRDRKRLYRRVDDAGYNLKIYVLDASRDVRRERVEQRNRAKGSTFSMIVPPHIFDLASDMWEPPDEAERSQRDMRFIRTDDQSSEW
jgi:predicted kinase